MANVERTNFKILCGKRPTFIVLISAMKLFFIVLLILVMGYNTNAQALLYIDSSVVSLDTMTVGSTFDTQWFIANNGNEPLRIDSIYFKNSMCVAYWPQHLLQPSDTAFIKIGCKCSDAGPYLQTMYIQTNSGKKANALYKVRIEAYIKTEQ